MCSLCIISCRWDDDSFEVLFCKLSNEFFIILCHSFPYTFWGVMLVNIVVKLLWGIFLRIYTKADDAIIILTNAIFLKLIHNLTHVICHRRTNCFTVSKDEINQPYFSFEIFIRN
ncbi:hypothetical protein MCCL_1005 [Macrococcoides caseolyticum JCSC5402]|uniref:Uncharacterized protein n=1 Tax=Macrococcus caseolyticus (strain JCSC5402) TaxID=458233 RepID=B9EBV1_MACCJ|nr:hypothetical protein MCCL_1005 [Macrococcus caseolyticus JCSC5402]